MNILVLGRGKTGSLVAQVAEERGHKVRAVASAENSQCQALQPQALSGIDVVIDFTTPDAVRANISATLRAGKPIVVGTTGWYQHLEAVRAEVEQAHGAVLFGSNFSIGVNVFFQIARAASAAVPFGYAAQIVERHHAQKKDVPSGTAVSLQRIFEENGGGKPEITSIREGEVVGTHVILLDSGNDTMMLVHDAKSRRGFAQGAVQAAEWLPGHAGVFDFRDVFPELSREKQK